MKKSFILTLVTFAFMGFTAVTGLAAETFRLWDNAAPGEPESATPPIIELWQPAVLSTDSCIIICPGGAYMGLAYGHEGKQVAEYFNSRGVTAVILKYRTPRRENVPKHLPAWQDAQRTVRLVRFHAKEWNINPEKIGILGFSAGGHLTLMTATTSQTPAYEPADELDKIPCNVNFAVPVYPAYVLEDGVDGENKGKGNNSSMVKDFAFDTMTPPMCFIHGDADPISAMGSIAVYHQLHRMDIPAELHIYAKVEHGYGATPYVRGNNHEGDWLNRVYEWMKVMNF